MNKCVLKTLSFHQIYIFPGTDEYILLVKCHIRHRDAIKIVGCVGVDPMSYHMETFVMH